MRAEGVIEDLKVGDSFVRKAAYRLVTFLGLQSGPQRSLTMGTFSRRPDTPDFFGDRLHPVYTAL